VALDFKKKATLKPAAAASFRVALFIYPQKRKKHIFKNCGKVEKFVENTKFVFK